MENFLRILKVTFYYSLFIAMVAILTIFTSSLIFTFLAVAGIIFIFLYIRCWMINKFSKDKTCIDF